jgi:hypothetical protein
MAGFGGLGGFGSGLGGSEFPDILTALGTALLSSPRDAPFASLPQTLALATQSGRQRQSDAALGLALTKAGVDPQAAATLALNPTAAALTISQQNLTNTNRLREQALRGVQSGGLLPPGAAPVSASPPVPTGTSSEIERRFLSPFAGLGLTNPVGLAAIGAYGQAESGFSPKRANAEWNDPSESGTPGTAGGIMSWRGDRLQNLYKFAEERGEARGNISPETQAAFLAHEDPTLIKSLQAARTPEEANSILAGKWRFAGYNRLGGENAYRLALTKTYLGRPGYAVGDMSDAPPGTPNDSAGAPTAPYNVAAGPGAKIPVPTQVTKLPEPVQAGGSNQTKVWAANQMQRGLAMMLYSNGDKGLEAAGQKMWEVGAKYAEPTEIERQVQAAFPNDPVRQREAMQSALDKRPELQKNIDYAYGGSPNDTPQVRAARERLKATLPDMRPEIVKAGEAAQDFPGLVKSGIEAKGAEKQADTEAAARGEFAKAATNSAEAATALQGAIKRASGHLENVVKLGGYGPWAAGRVGRFVDQAMGGLGPGGAPQQEAEVERQHFDAAMATVRNAVTAARARASGDRQVSNLDRVLLGVDLPILTSSSPEVAREGFKQLQSDINRAVELDKKFGLYRGEQRAGEPITDAPAGTTRSGVKWSISP